MRALQVCFRVTLLPCYPVTLLPAALLPRRPRAFLAPSSTRRRHAALTFPRPRSSFAAAAAAAVRHFPAPAADAGAWLAGPRGRLRVGYLSHDFGARRRLGQVRR